ncbi:VanW family protein [Lentibacillus saliphilus]|uniref:VanW family protein n=1 Tax=Lentibacillus saliphilus TaxID=2737028 RepID=UPI001FE4DC8C|nr:VanW family protein [Lentibacillus saliphilus]
MKHALSIMTIMFLLWSFTQTITAAQIDVFYKEDLIRTVDGDYFMIDGTGGLILDRHKLHAFIQTLEEHVYKQPKNATLTKKGHINSEVPGIRINQALFMRRFLEHMSLNTHTEMTIPTEVIYPRVDSELLDQLRRNKLGEYTTHFKHQHKERSHNIDLAAQAINNHVVFPGESFSFNEVVGKRTEERGYMRAPVIVKGELSEGIGGGICQVSSTLFNAVSLKGIQIVKRYSHSRDVPYVPPGRDAAVSWWGPDFVFKNRYSQPLLIRAAAKNGTLHVQIYSTPHVKVKGEN